MVTETIPPRIPPNKGAGWTEVHPFYAVIVGSRDRAGTLPNSRGLRAGIPFPAEVGDECDEGWDPITRLNSTLAV